MSIPPEDYLIRIKAALAAHAVPAEAQAMAAYMRHFFPFYGVKKPLREQILKELTGTYGRPKGSRLQQLVRLLWKEPERECQYIAVSLLGRERRHLDGSFLPLIEELIQEKSWWDTVDTLAGKVTNAVLLGQPELISGYPDRWIESENLWLNRAAILFQLKHKQQTDSKRLFNYILHHAGSDEFFIQKASGWALREYSKVDPAAVQQFIKQHQLPPLTVREGLKWIKQQA